MATVMATVTCPRRKLWASCALKSQLGEVWAILHLGFSGANEGAPAASLLQYALIDSPNGVDVVQRRPCRNRQRLLALPVRRTLLGEGFRTFDIVFRFAHRLVGRIGDLVADGVGD